MPPIGMDTLMAPILVLVATLAGVVLIWFINFCGKISKNNSDGSVTITKPLGGRAYSICIVAGLICTVGMAVWTLYPDYDSPHGQAWKDEPEKVELMSKDEVKSEASEIRARKEEKVKSDKKQKRKELEADSDELFNRLMERENAQRKAEREQED